MNKKLTQGKKHYNSGQYKKALMTFNKLEAELAALMPVDIISSKLADEEKNTPTDEELNNQDIFVECSYYKGLTLTKLERYDDALHYLKQVVNAVQPGLLYVYQSRMIMGYIKIILKRYKLAEYEFNKLLSD
jgi:tetratricopeptide (TPR) repeat protein